MRIVIFLAGFLMLHGAAFYCYTKWQAYLIDAASIGSLNGSLRQLGQPGLSLPPPPNLGLAALAASVGFSIMLLGCALIAAGRPDSRIRLGQT
ncbi:hypothetical protein P7L87_26015 [Vibrio parahaemolyticus]|nr:hypothetical protein [Vibrio parahaemolyticus]